MLLLVIMAETARVLSCGFLLDVVIEGEDTIEPKLPTEAGLLFTRFDVGAGSEFKNPKNV